MKILRKKSALSEAEGLLKNLKDNLSGKDGYIWLKTLKQYMRKEPIDWSILPKSDVWKTIMNGEYKSFYMVENTYLKLGFKMYGRAESLAKELRYQNFDEYEINLGLFSFTDLGFSENEKVSYQTIFLRAMRMGLKKCNAFDGLAVRVVYKEQPKDEFFDEHIIIGMDVINDQVFDLKNDHGYLVLSTALIKSKIGKNKFGNKSKFIFRLN
jgi:hypothetical protein